MRDENPTGARVEPTEPWPAPPGKTRDPGPIAQALEVQEKNLEELREILADLTIALRPALRPTAGPAEPGPPSTVEEIRTSEVTRQVQQNNKTIQAVALDAAGLLDHLDI